MASPTPTRNTTRLLLLSCLVAALHVTAASAAAMASVTRSGVIPLDVQSLRPTEAPIMLDLARRQNSFTYFVAPDGICGWESQNITKYRCVFWQADGSRPEGRVCCPAEGCTPDIQMVRHYQLYGTGTFSPSDLIFPGFSTIHSTGTLPYCHTFFYGSSGRYPAFTCGGTSRTAPSVYLTVKPGTTRFFATSTSLATLRTTVTSSNGAAVTKVVTVTPTGPTNGRTGDVDESGGASSGSLQPSNNGGGSDNGGGGSSSANTGAIVGGAVGGAAVLAVFALAAVLLYRRRKKNTSHPDGASAGPSGSGYYPMSPSQPDSTAFTPSSYNTPGIPWAQNNGHSVSSVSPGLSLPPNAPHYEGAYPKYPAPMAEVDGTGPNRAHEMAAN
ncbi:hypothetical protein MCOR07_004219 [Pyricularia oryzae]|uniref:Uncharacterized protein n=1 Tax=Pyricularia grisea TaxID=148305 RepID=A0ABQ8N3Y6_PYRGI|nr:hypothetical protein MCOR01_006055 [Pyricularia oryzae]KAI6290851.1 hypothetical protein MCOR33_011008 [Pyricularia grisea]KAI6284394.1 hypothetical protein MCOR26_002025 [Pyricularia oryzae]KAI6319113.1 hypothetical protein MCOR29_005688 [Pyricularia oryzae]KAI6346198.1 hypothetical protein MCOR28_003063 [Pyricularia oryzae]